MSQETNIDTPPTAGVSAPAAIQFNTLDDAKAFFAIAEQSAPEPAQQEESTDAEPAAEPSRPGLLSSLFGSSAELARLNDENDALRAENAGLLAMLSSVAGEINEARELAATVPVQVAAQAADVIAAQGQDPCALPEPELEEDASDIGSIAELGAAMAAEPDPHRRAALYRSHRSQLIGRN